MGKTTQTNTIFISKDAPAAAFQGFFVAAPSVLTLIQLRMGGDHMTSTILGALGGWIGTLNDFIIANSLISRDEAFVVLQPDMYTEDIILLMMIFQWMNLSLIMNEDD